MKSFHHCMVDKRQRWKYSGLLTPHTFVLSAFLLRHSLYTEGETQSIVKPIKFILSNFRHPQNVFFYFIILILFFYHLILIILFLLFYFFNTPYPVDIYFSTSLYNVCSDVPLFKFKCPSSSADNPVPIQTTAYTDFT